MFILSVLDSQYKAGRARRFHHWGLLRNTAAFGWCLHKALGFLWFIVWFIVWFILWFIVGGLL